MNDKLTRNDIKKMEDEIEHRTLAIPKEAWAAGNYARPPVQLRKIFDTYYQKNLKIKMRVAYVILNV